MMKLLVVLSFIGLVAAHTSITQVIVNGNAQSTCIRPQFPASEWQTGLGFQSPISNLYAPVIDGLMSTNYTCGFMPYAGQPAAGKCSVQAGSQIQVQFYHGGIAGEGPADVYIASSHKGPIYAYMARWEQNGGIPSGPVWFKVFQADIIQYGGGVNTPNLWASNDLLNANGGKINIQIPSDIQPGNYILRTELIAYHDGRDRGRQPYVNCAELTVTGGGSAAPGGASFPGSYDWSDAALRYNIYTADANAAFPVPGNIPLYKAGSNPTPAPTPSPPSPTPPAPTPSGSGSLASGQQLGEKTANGGALYSSTRSHVAIMQPDANLVVYTLPSYGLVWASGTWASADKGPFLLGLQGDGNLVIYDGKYNALWGSGSWGKGTGPYSLVMQTDGNLVYYDSYGVNVWSTNVALGDVGVAASAPIPNNSTTGPKNVSVDPNYNPFPASTSADVSSTGDAAIGTGSSAIIEISAVILSICLLFSFL